MSMWIGRILALVVVNLLGYLVLKRLWPGLLNARRVGVFLALTLLSLVAWTLLVALGLGPQGQVPGLTAPLKLFFVGWTVAAMIVAVFGLPFLLVRWWRGRRAPALAVDPVSGAVDLERRSLLVNAGRAVPFLAMGTSSAGIATGISGFEVLEVEVRMKDLPPALEGFRIGQITDVHVGTFISPEYVRQAVAAMNEAGVHLQVMTGDLIDDLTQLDETMEALAGCRAQHGMVAILGNHEYWRGIGPILEGYKGLEKRGAPVRLLVDASHVLEHGGQRLRVVGVDYPMRSRRVGSKAEGFRRSSETAFQGTSPEELVLCLTHHPSFFPYAAERGAHLTLAGHTHGGQVALLGMPLFWFAFEFMLGRYRWKDRHLYVSGGTGHWLPFRIGVPPEVTILTLRAA
ncbi:metallophosphoesterase [Hyalangium rubrum]|uniref:Metallophosphoesterase n=1 Tax=Hyalangium rubrum TaxID=3103134 RepID=A0ABU5GWY7_9BACT|nr:metallophosphoesterase [Hyalangium sp. s54d21]MDY7225057.1 metallophosphoesterase [Hyalangium sp. s54d21]